MEGLAYIAGGSFSHCRSLLKQPCRGIDTPCWVHVRYSHGGSICPTVCTSGCVRVFYNKGLVEAIMRMQAMIATGLAAMLRMNSRFIRPVAILFIATVAATCFADQQADLVARIRANPAVGRAHASNHHLIGAGCYPIC